MSARGFRVLIRTITAALFTISCALVVVALVSTKLDGGNEMLELAVRAFLAGCGVFTASCAALSFHEMSREHWQ